MSNTPYLGLFPPNPKSSKTNMSAYSWQLAYIKWNRIKDSERFVKLHLTASEPVAFAGALE